MANTIQRPGLGLPIQHSPEWKLDDKPWKRFPNGITDPLCSAGVTVRERRMLAFINQITDKVEWERKVYDESIVGKWEKEVMEYNCGSKDVFLSETMLAYCISELRDKAERFKTTKVIAVLDAELTVVKADHVVPADLLAALKNGVAALEDVPEDKRDWHPGSDKMVLDLVHPSMCPLAYGISHVLPDELIALQDSLRYCGTGKVLEKPADFSNIGRKHFKGYLEDVELPIWGSFQWLPSEIKFRGDGTTTIDSYVNSLHPTLHAELYPVLEKLLDCAVPLWNESLSWFHDRRRIKIDATGDEDYYIPEGMEPPNGSGSQRSDEEDSALSDSNDSDWEREVRVLIQRAPEEFESFEAKARKAKVGACHMDLREKFAETGLQVIFKLANILLTPEKSQYEGGTWHVEGALNEHIVATAIYYYEQDNITDSTLEFRQNMDTEELIGIPMQNEFDSVEEYFGIKQEGNTIQHLGHVVTREGRMLAFPNVLQHRVGDFELKDKTKPGHRKILVMFLVDPHIKVLSTANVPPQQKDWFDQQISSRDTGRLTDLPPELFEKVMDELEGWPLDYQAQCKIRDDLMAERGLMNQNISDVCHEETFSFCEH